MLAPEATLAAASPFCEAAIVYRSGSEAYQEAVAGIRETVGDAPCMLHYIDLENPADEKWLAEHASGLKLAAAVGIGVYQKITSTGSSAAVIPAIVLRADLKTESNRLGAVYADVPLATQLENLKGLFPSRLRVALIHRAGHELPDGAALARIRRLGYELRVVDCAGPEKLLAVFSALKGKTDFVLTEPDQDLYNSATIKPLVLASLSQALPILGFSATFVRAGALVGVYPDFRDLGRQTGTLVARLLESNNLDRGPRTETEVREVVVTVNSRIARMLGLEPVRLEGVQVLK
jgi:putative ABC transport system substrate-binding protein